ncbi:Aste57867_6359 [Aphanomyces stellatus]|uniref:Aste57867_6359 protein n=1 Tax=Aphanomyces stellatus TaxID=120398 RepID=A0A485KEP5_9STRA|nr:hypothetical protein As57867_006344 [Aphanomyces stellatus]VFT83356.1 Aste57867_6359 [Aphanomyces stellatus]
MVRLTAFVLLAATASAYRTYIAKFPNGDKVAGVAAIGHVDPKGDGPRNPFGLAFAAAGKEWTTALCQADSDGDGATNGQELGDPCCTWKAGEALPATFKATPPGKADTFTPDQLKALQCTTGAATAAPGANATNNATRPATAAPAVTAAATTTAKPTKSDAASASLALASAAAAMYLTAMHE